MTIHQSLQYQYLTAIQLGTRVAQFSLNTPEIMKLGYEMIEQRLLPPSRIHVANKMAFSGTIEDGTTFMGVPLCRR